VLSVIRKRSFLSVPPALEGPSDIIRAEGAIIRQTSASKHSSEKLYREWEGGRTPLLEATGFWLGNLRVKATIKAGSTLA
jgi:hypothetical protein